MVLGNFDVYKDMNKEANSVPLTKEQVLVLSSFFRIIFLA